MNAKETTKIMLTNEMRKIKETIRKAAEAGRDQVFMDWNYCYPSDTTIKKLRDQGYKIETQTLAFSEKWGYRISGWREISEEGKAASEVWERVYKFTKYNVDLDYSTSWYGTKAFPGKRNKDGMRMFGPEARLFNTMLEQASFKSIEAMHEYKIEVVSD